MKSSFQIAVVGDIHDQWDEGDRQALHHLGVDLVLFVGDIGNEAVPIVAEIASLDLPKAVILGNHDAWYTASESGKKKSPYQDKVDRVQQQLDLLGAAYVGYRCLDFPHLGISVVGSRPFSWGGSEWKKPSFYAQRFGVTSFAESVAKILVAVQEAQQEAIIFLGHSGPFGLGALPSDPCGRDWKLEGGDYGDPDFQQAIDRVIASGRPVPLVTFGHMHLQLKNTDKLRKAFCFSPQNTLYLNAASVPRWRMVGGYKSRNFTVVSFTDRRVTAVALVWIDEMGTIGEVQTYWQGSPLDRATPPPVKFA